MKRDATDRKIPRALQFDGVKTTLILRLSKHEPGVCIP